CGFDATEAPVAAALREFEALVRRVEAELTRFFAQESVRARVRSWVDSRIECTDGTLRYLEGSAPWPDVENMALFDQHLAGLDLARQVDVAELLALARERMWERDGLLRAVGQLFDRYGDRLQFRSPEPEARTELSAWCVAQALRAGARLPAAFTRAEEDSMAAAIRPEWITATTLDRLDELALPEPVVRRVLELVLDGAVPMGSDRPRSRA